jgi:hypothetical protein
MKDNPVVVFSGPRPYVWDDVLMAKLCIDSPQSEWLGDALAPLGIDVGNDHDMLRAGIITVPASSTTSGGVRYALPAPLALWLCKYAANRDTNKYLFISDFVADEIIDEILGS